MKKQNIRKMHYITAFRIAKIKKSFFCLYFFLTFIQRIHDKASACRLKPKNCSQSRQTILEDIHMCVRPEGKIKAWNNTRITSPPPNTYTKIWPLTMEKRVLGYECRMRERKCSLSKIY